MVDNYVILPDVKTLRFIADNWSRDQKVNSSDSSSANETPHDAQAITRLISNASLAVQDPYSKVVSDFVKRYRKAQDLNIRRTSNATLEDELEEFQDDIDQLFFFELLMRKTPGIDRLVRVEVVDHTEEKGSVATYVPNPKGPIIQISRYNSKGDSRTFGQLLHTLVHEMCHAYFSIFSDRRHRKHKAWVDDFERHGEMFWVLLRFIMGRIAVFTKSERWKKELDEMEFDCYQLTGKRGGHGAWGTPEKILMGGVLPH